MGKTKSRSQITRDPIILIGGAVLLTAVSFVVGGYSSRRSAEMGEAESKAETEEGETSLGSIVQAGDWTVHFKKGQIAVGPNWILDAENSPKLFGRTGEDFYAYSAELIDDQVDQKQFVAVSVNTLENGASRSLYTVILDPKERQTVYETPDLYAVSPHGALTAIGGSATIKLELDPYFLWSSDEENKLRLLEFLTFDPNVGRFLPANKPFVAEFKELLDEYNLIAHTKCLFDGKIRKTYELKAEIGGGAKCDDAATGEKAPTNFITLTEFEKLRERAKQVIVGKRSSLLGN